MDTNQNPSPSSENAQQSLDLSAIRGQEHVKRALEIAACGGHSLVLCGVPGAGKSLLSKTLSTLLPPLEDAELRELQERFLRANRAFPSLPAQRYRLLVMPAPTMSPSVLLGQGTWEQPGEMLLAQHGVLLLDRLDRFAPSLIRLWEALCDRPEWVSVQMVVTLQPCPCGFYDHPLRECTCPTQALTQYRDRFRSAVERLPMFVEVPPLDVEQMVASRRGETSAQVRERVLAGTAYGKSRQAQTGALRNAALDPAAIQQFCQPDVSGQKLFKAAIAQLHLSVRASHSVLRVARTIADLANCEQIQANHLAEAIQYQPRW